MRFGLVTLLARMPTALAAVMLLLAGNAGAETRTFILANDGRTPAAYACLRSAPGCDPAVLHALCREHGFEHAVGHRKLDRDEITGEVPSGHPGSGQALYAVECAR